MAAQFKNVIIVVGVEMRKFKIGDIVCRIGYEKEKQEVIDIIYNKQEYKGNWTCNNVIIEVENCYILKKEKDGLLTFLGFGFEEEYKIINFSSNISSFNICPRCNKTLTEKFSKYTNTIIQKCKNCGWC